MNCSVAPPSLTTARRGLVRYVVSMRVVMALLFVTSVVIFFSVATVDAESDDGSILNDADLDKFWQEAPKQEDGGICYEVMISPRRRCEALKR